MYILPMPKNMEVGEDFYRLKYNTKLILDKKCLVDCFQYVKILKQEIEEVTGFSLEIVKGTMEKGQIHLSLQDDMDANADLEGYQLTINADGIIVVGNSKKGLLHGIQTLRQIIRQQCTKLSYVRIVDAPDIKNRGYYFDCTRGRVPKLEQLKKLADTCSFYKLNQLQLYVEHTYLFQNQSEVWCDNTPLTADEILELDAYCRELNIDLVPSLASFGHLYQLLRTDSYSHLCELEVDEKEEYSLIGRMKHHTVDVTNEESFQLVTDRIYEYMQLFTSRYFNICADETFDLGKGKSKKEAEKSGVTDIYVSFLERLCQFVMEQGRIPMFWGDILVSHPEKVAELPQEAICLNWEYEADVKEDGTRNFAEAGVKHLYVCPGVQSWNHLINNQKAAYANISRMCTFAHKYHAEGILNTDWGDCGHIAHPDFSVVGLIYGAAFSWNQKIVPEEDMNRQISKIHYGDNTEKLVWIFRKLGETECVNWWNVVQYYEYHGLGLEEWKIDRILECGDLEKIQKKIQEMDETVEALYDIIPEVKEDEKDVVKAYIFMAEGQKLIAYAAIFEDEKQGMEQRKNYAERLEHWLYHYKKLWRSVSKESELHRIADVLLWYAGRMRKGI